MENLPLIIYLIETLGTIFYFISVVAIFSIVAIFLVVAVIIPMNEYKKFEEWEHSKPSRYDYYNNGEYRDKLVKWKKNKVTFSYSFKQWNWVFVPLFVLLLCNFVPSKQIMYTMLGVSVGTQALQSEYGQDMTGEASEVFIKGLKLLNNKLDEQLTEE
jgi:hypothetical protein